MHLVLTRNQNLYHQCQVWVKSPALHLLSLKILQLCHLPPSHPPPVSNFSYLFIRCQPLYVSCCTVLLYFSRYSIARLKKFCLFVCFFNVLGNSSGKEPTCQCRRRKRCEFDPWVGKILWRRARHPTPVFLPGESHGQRSLAGYSPWDCKESYMTEVT